MPSFFANRQLCLEICRPRRPLSTQSSARTPRAVRLGRFSRSSIRPKPASAARSFSLAGEITVRLALISRINHRRRIAVSRSSSASSDFACCARVATPSMVGEGLNATDGPRLSSRPSNAGRNGASSRGRECFVWAVGGSFSVCDDSGGEP
jgi:hypothetical protein